MLLRATLLSLAIVAGQSDPEAVVRGYLDAMRALDVDRMHQVLADDYRLFDDGSSRLHDRTRARDIVAWERGMGARWSHRILAVHGDTVIALLEEDSEYFTLLGLERGVQVRSYVVRSGRIHESHGHLFVTARGSQAEALGAFKRWLREQPQLPDARMMGPMGNLLLTAASAEPMLLALRRWRDERGKEQR